MFDTGAQLRKVRKKSNYTLDQLAALSGIDRGTISRIELGHVSPRIDTIVCLCEAMNTSLPQFFHPELPAGPGPGEQLTFDLSAAAGTRPDADVYWPVPATVWQSLVDVVERFEAILANSGELALVLDRAGRIIYLSPGGENILGYKRSEVLGTSILELVHLEDHSRFSAALTGTGPGSAVSRHYRLKCRRGEWMRFDCTLTDHLHSPSVRAVIMNAAPLPV